MRFSSIVPVVIAIVSAFVAGMIALSVWQSFSHAPDPVVGVESSEVSPVAASPASVGGGTPGTLEGVKARGVLRCGVNAGSAGFATIDAKGNWSGFLVDTCRALGAAVLGDDTKVEYAPLGPKEALLALQSGEIDVLARNTTWTLSRDAGQGVDFTGIVYFDGQGFMVRKSLGVSSASQLSNATICTAAGTTMEQNVADYFNPKGIKYTLLTFGSRAELTKPMNQVAAMFLLPIPRHSIARLRRFPNQAITPFFQKLYLGSRLVLRFARATISGWIL